MELVPNEPSYTIIRVKRKLADTTHSTASDDSDRVNSFKRLRHIGSFANKPDEATLTSNNLLKRMGFGSRKRIRISDLNSEQFQAYVERLDEKDAALRKTKKVKAVVEGDDHDEPVAEEVEVVEEPKHNSDDNGIFNIGLTEDDFVAPSQDNNNNQKGMTTGH